MSMQTYLTGRLRNTSLPLGQGLLPLFEAVVNSIHSVDGRPPDSGLGKIRVEILRVPQQQLPMDDGKGKRGIAPLEQIIEFSVTDNGVGFNDPNLESFRTLDTDYKAALGCRGVGRLMWLKAFDRVEISSDYKSSSNELRHREFSFKPAEGVTTPTESQASSETPSTTVRLIGFSKGYSSRTSKSAKTIASNLLEHCLWYFVRPGGAPSIEIKDGDELINLEDIYEEYMLSSTERSSIKVKDESFELTHIKLKAGSEKQPFIAWCAAGRLVEEENITGKVPGLFGKLRDEGGEFIYACYVASPFLDSHVRPDRTAFEAVEAADELFAESSISFKEVKDAVCRPLPNNSVNFFSRTRMPVESVWNASSSRNRQNTGRY